MPTDRPSSSKRPTRRTSSSVGEGPVSDKLQSFEFERASDNDFGAGLSEETRRPSRPPSREPAAEAPAADEGSRRRRTIAGKPRVSASAPEPAPSAEPPRTVRETSGRESTSRSAPSYNEDRRPREDADRGERYTERSSDEGDRSESSSQDRDDGGRRPRRRRRGRGGEGQGSSGQRSSGPRSIAARAPAQSRTPPSGRDRGGSSRGPSDRGPSDRGGQSDRGQSSGGRYSRAPQQTQSQPQSEGRRGRGERRSVSSSSGDRQSRYLQNAPIPSGEVVGELEPLSGVLELHPKGYGFLRLAKNDYGAEDSDAFVSSSLIETHKLREGIKILGDVGMGPRGQGLRLVNVKEINDGPVEHYEKTKNFDELTPINPYEQIKLETGTQPITMRVMDLLTPIGKGTRALIVAPPRSGKTMLLQDIANSVAKNHPEIHLIVLLVDERPEEVTDMRRNVKGEVVASSMDRDVESHVRISQLVIERGKRLAESGKHCLILMDSITRCARAFNKWIGGGRDSKIGTGGLDNRALEIPRRMFGTARRFEEGGSLTVVATALIETGNRMDDSIFLEFKGTGNMELVLSRDLAERRVWPAIDVSRSGTRRDEKILAPDVIEGVTMLRRSLAALNTTEAMETLVKTLQRFPSNKDFLEKIRSVL